MINTIHPETQFFPAHQKKSHYPNFDNAFSKQVYLTPYYKDSIKGVWVLVLGYIKILSLSLNKYVLKPRIEHIFLLGYSFFHLDYETLERISL